MYIAMITRPDSLASMENRGKTGGTFPIIGN
eukprot:SAG31_NODE_44479_length_262_cov_1.263804_1_plen_30_part_10